MTETFHGYIDTTQDVLLVFESCRRGLLPRVNRRLQEKERKLIKSGTVFVFDEKESGVKRWTDGLVWSPSRILGNFLIYRELEKRKGEKRVSVSDQRQRSYSVDISSKMGAAGGGFLSDRAKEKRLVGSLSDVYNFKTDGLIKKTMSIVVNGSTQHLISYYHPQDIVDGKLRTPSSVPELTSLEISPELLVKQNFRIPPFVEPTFDQIADPTTMRSQGVTTKIDTRTTTSPPNTMSSLRSMSVGSLNSLRQESFLYTTNSNHQPIHNDTLRQNTMSSPEDGNKSSVMYSRHLQQSTPPHNATVYLPMPASTPSPNSLRYELMPHNHQHYQQHDQGYHSSLPPNPHLGHLLNPVHPLNDVQSSGSSSNKLDQPILYGNSPLSTTSRLA